MTTCNKRVGHRGVVTKLTKEVEELLTTGETMFTAEQLTLLQVKQQQLHSKLKVLDDIDKQMLDKCETSQIEQVLRFLLHQIIHVLNLDSLSFLELLGTVRRMSLYSAPQT